MTQPRHAKQAGLKARLLTGSRTAAASSRGQSPLKGPVSSRKSRNSHSSQGIRTRGSRKSSRRVSVPKGSRRVSSQGHRNLRDSSPDHRNRVSLRDSSQGPPSRVSLSSRTSSPGSLSSSPRVTSRDNRSSRTSSPDRPSRDNHRDSPSSRGSRASSRDRSNRSSGSRTATGVREHIIMTSRVPRGMTRDVPATLNSNLHQCRETRPSRRPRINNSRSSIMSIMIRTCHRQTSFCSHLKTEVKMNRICSD